MIEWDERVEEEEPELPPCITEIAAQCGNSDLRIYENFERPDDCVVEAVSRLFSHPLKSASDCRSECHAWAEAEALSYYLEFNRYYQQFFSGCVQTRDCDSLGDGTVSFDSECNVVRNPDPRTVCSFDIVYNTSPISLLWHGQAMLEGRAALVPFSLELGRKNGWSIWRGSAQAPLLVWDPERSGRITSASQLFGNWTFGGRRESPERISASGDALRMPWKHGFEALALLDADGDGRVAGEELDELSLWFDEDRNGVSQPGEVIPAEDAGLRSLYYEPDRVDPRSRDIIATSGFERRQDGRIVTGPAVDWFGKVFETKDAALRYLEERNIRPLAPPVATLSATEAAPLPDLTGVWRWTLAEDERISSSAHNVSRYRSSFLIFQQVESEITGYSAVEMQLTENDEGLRSFARAYPLRGSYERSQDGALLLRFNVQARQAVTENLVTVLAGGNRLRGVSRVTIPDEKGAQTMVEYHWSAARLGGSS